MRKCAVEDVVAETARVLATEGIVEKGAGGCHKGGLDRGNRKDREKLTVEAKL